MAIRIRSSLRRMSAWSGLLLMTNPTVQPTQQGWAVIQPLHAEYQFVLPEKPDAELPSFTAYLKGPSGASVYKFECHAGGYPDDSEMTWSGDFQCALFPYRGDTVTPVNLLAVDTHEEQSVDWRNRGRMIAAQLQGDCLQNPEYSTQRHFRLRGMDLSLAYADIGWAPGQKLQKFTLSVDAAPDKDAKTPMAEAADGPSPPTQCYPGPKG
ncbi:MAG: hypothetical protein ACHQAU_05445 [Gammaproteobacteria bacterium]